VRQHQFWSRVTRWVWLARLKRRLRQLGLLNVPNEPHPEAVVIRFTPMSPQGVLHRAELGARRSDGKGHHTASVWADRARPGETREQVIVRLLAVTELHGLDPARNPHLWWCSSAQKLLAERFTFEKDGYDGEPDEHYSVILGYPPTLGDAERFVAAFTKERRPGQ
jgi:hypothetical protein